MYTAGLGVGAGPIGHSAWKWASNLGKLVEWLWADIQSSLGEWHLRIMEQSRRVMSSRPARQGGGQWSSGLDALHYKIRHLDTTCPSASSDHSGLKEALHDRPPQSMNMPFGQSNLLAKPGLVGLCASNVHQNPGAWYKRAAEKC